MKNSKRYYLQLKFCSVVLLLLILSATMQGCKKDDFSYQVQDRQVLMLDELKKDTGLSIAIMALEKAGMAATLDAYGPITFFAPDNNAFRKYFANRNKKSLEDFTAEEIKTIMIYHILPTRLKSPEFVQGPQGTATGRGDYITLDISKGYKFNTVANGIAKVYATDLQYANGLVHKMDGVLDPPTLSIGQFLAQNPAQYSILYSGLQRAGLIDTLTNLTDASNNRIRLTLFAETNEVLKAAGIQSYDNMPVDELKTLMRDHIIAGSNFSSSYTKLTAAIPGINVVERWDSTILTLDRQHWIYFNLAGSRLINEKMDFGASDVIMRNGLLHNVSKPLVWDSSLKRTQIYHVFWQNTNYAYGIPGFTSTTPPVALASSGNWRYYLEGTPGHPRGQNFLFMNPDGTGDSLVTVVKNVRRGKYKIEVDYKAGGRGDYQLMHGQDLIGTPLNYGLGATFQQKVVIGTYKFETSGDKRLNFVCTRVGGINLECLVLTPVYN